MFAVITPKRVTSGGVRLQGLALGSTVPKKRRSGGEPLTTLRAILTKPMRLPAPTARVGQLENSQLFQIRLELEL